MKAVILVGGEGTRLRPLTYNTTKAMVPVLNKPFLEHLLGYLKGHRVTDIILAMSYLPHRIQGHFGDGAKMSLSLSYFIEEEPLGTAGAVKNAENAIDESFFVLNGDILTDIDLTAMMRQHRQAKAKVSIALTPVEDPTIYGVVETDAQGMVARFLEKPKREEATTNMINAGIYIVEPEVLDYIPPTKPTMFEHYVFPLLLEKGEPILGYPSESYWIDIGTPEKYLRLNHDLLLGKAPSLFRATGGVQTGDGSQISPSADIKAPVLIGEECVIGPGVEIKGPTVLGPKCKVDQGATIEGAVLWDNVRVGKKVTLRNCIAASHSEIHQESEVLDNCVLGDNVVVGKNSKLPKGTRIRPDKRIAPGSISF
jgi:mannose-1-phosphate guanylyltransferase